MKNRKFESLESLRASVASDIVSAHVSRAQCLDKMARLINYYGRLADGGNEDAKAILGIVENAFVRVYKSTEAHQQSAASSWPFVRLDKFTEADPAGGLYEEPAASEELKSLVIWAGMMRLSWL